MNRILDLINVMKDFSSVEAFSKIGSVKKQIGNQYFLYPVDTEYTAISILMLNDKIQKMGIQLSNEISLVDIEKCFSKKAEIKESFYDGITYFSFLEKDFRISFIQRDTSKKQSSFNKVEVFLINN
jgi:hypothetical protein